MSIERDKPTSGRLVAYIPSDALIEGRGYRVSFVVEGEYGHRPTGHWPYEGKPGQQLPWFWGPDYESAKKQALEFNIKMGVDECQAFKIIAESMRREKSGEEDQ